MDVDKTAFGVLYLDMEGFEGSFELFCSTVGCLAFTCDLGFFSVSFLMLTDGFINLLETAVKGSEEMIEGFAEFLLGCVFLFNHG